MGFYWLSLLSPTRRRVGGLSFDFVYWFKTKIWNQFVRRFFEGGFHDCPPTLRRVGLSNDNQYNAMATSFQAGVGESRFDRKLEESKQAQTISRKWPPWRFFNITGASWTRKIAVSAAYSTCQNTPASARGPHTVPKPPIGKLNGISHVGKQAKLCCAGLLKVIFWACSSRYATNAILIDVSNKRATFDF